ncbi:hypothetical protein PT974_06202 [Cladobotryum mycophilum]|uniref:Uncharacterized protein n=1 Tax=Cladobotryum mycophilum TaxID=491253 RepID=A0ABR0SKU2_9HYPO
MGFLERSSDDGTRQTAYFRTDRINEPATEIRKEDDPINPQ